MFNITDNILVDRSAITISKILKEIRKARLQEAYSIARGMGEIWEVKLDENTACGRRKIGELNLPKMCRVIGLLRGDELIFPNITTKLEVGDTILAYVDSSMIKQAEQIFC